MIYNNRYCYLSVITSQNQLAIIYNNYVYSNIHLEGEPSKKTVVIIFGYWRPGPERSWSNSITNFFIFLVFIYYILGEYEYYFMSFNINTDYIISCINHNKTQILYNQSH